MLNYYKGQNRNIAGTEPEYQLYLSISCLIFYTNNVPIELPLISCSVPVLFQFLVYFFGEHCNI